MSESESSNQETSEGHGSQPANEPTIDLDQFLKTCGVESGGQAKRMIQSGEVLVNNEIETRRRKKLRQGDQVTLFDEVYVVRFAEGTDGELSVEMQG